MRRSVLRILIRLEIGFNALMPSQSPLLDEIVGDLIGHKHACNAAKFLVPYQP